MEMDGLIQMQIGQQEQIVMAQMPSQTMLHNGVMKIMMDTGLTQMEIILMNVQMRQELQQ